MSTEMRQKVIEQLHEVMTTSAFAEGIEDKIARSLEAMSDADLMELARKQGLWLPG